MIHVTCELLVGRKNHRSTATNDLAALVGAAPLTQPGRKIRALLEIRNGAVDRAHRTLQGFSTARSPDVNPFRSSSRGNRTRRSNHQRPGRTESNAALKVTHRLASGINPSGAWASEADAARALLCIQHLPCLSPADVIQSTEFGLQAGRISSLYEIVFPVDQYDLRSRCKPK